MRSKRENTAYIRTKGAATNCHDVVHDEHERRTGEETEQREVRRVEPELGTPSGRLREALTRARIRTFHIGSQLAVTDKSGQC